MGYTASDAIERIVLKAWTGQSRALTDAQLLALLNDSLRSYVVPLTKSLREEWWVGKADIEVTTDSDSQVTLPNSVASTLRTVAWDNAGILQPLSRIEPETSFAYQPSGGGVPGGYMLRGYTLEILPHIASLPLVLTAMLRPAEMVLEEDAAEITDISGSDVTVSAVPLAWQSSAPDTLDAVSGESPFSVIDSDFSLVSIASNVITISAFAAAQLSVGDWLADVGYTPFPNLPVELHPLLELDVIRTMFEGLGDKRLEGIVQRQLKMESELRKTMAPRTQGNARPILNPNAPGMRLGRGWYGY